MTQGKKREDHISPLPYRGAPLSVVLRYKYMIILVNGKKKTIIHKKNLVTRK